MAEPKDTGKKTSAGRIIWNDGGKDYSERTTTVKASDGRYYTIPTVDENGKQPYSDDILIEYIDKYGPIDFLTGEKLPKFKTEKEAIMYAKERSKTRKSFAEGGVMQNVKSMQDQMDLFDYGGIKDDGMLRDPVSGNEVPPGSMAKEVRDDIPAMLSEGEYVVPADVLRYYGVSFFENLRNQAKNNLQQMERTGRIGGEPISPEQAQRNMQIKPVGMPKPATANQGGMMTGFQNGGDNSAFSTQNLPQGRNPIEYFSPFSTMSSSAIANRAAAEAAAGTTSITQFRKHYNATGKFINIKYISDPNNPGEFIIDTSDPQNVENAAAYPITEEGYAALKPEFEEQKRDRREFVPDKKPDTSFLEGISANDAEGLKNKAGELLDLKNMSGLTRPGGLGPPGLQLLGGISSINRLAQAKGIMQFAKDQEEAGVKEMNGVAGEIQTLINYTCLLRDLC